MSCRYVPARACTILHAGCQRKAVRVQECMRMHPHHVHHAAVLPDKKPLLSVPNQLALSVLWFALNFQNAALLPIVVPTQILLFTGSGQVGNAQQATLLGWLSALGSVVAMLVQPITGALSDRPQGALGPRRPHIIVATAPFFPAALLLPPAPALS